jgi:PD-(D/E)XK nuclease superfamily
MLEIQDEHPDKLLHRAITEAIIGVAFEVHRELGYGFLERVYQRALQVELSRRSLSADIEKTDSGAIQRRSCRRLRCRFDRW